MTLPPITCPVCADPDTFVLADPRAKTPIRAVLYRCRSCGQAWELRWMEEQ